MFLEELARLCGLAMSLLCEQRIFVVVEDLLFYQFEVITALTVPDHEAVASYGF